MHKSRIHRIVGKKGETLRKISADTNVRIYVPELREDKPDSNPHETVKVRSPLSQRASRSTTVS